MIGIKCLQFWLNDCTLKYSCCNLCCGLQHLDCLLRFRETYRSQLLTIFVVDLNVKFNSWDDLTSFRRMVIQKECGNKLRDASGGSEKKERKVAQPKSSFFFNPTELLLFLSLVRYFVNHFSFHFNWVTATGTDARWLRLDELNMQRHKSQCSR